MESWKEGPLEIVAYSAWGFQVKLVPAWTPRAWMDATDQKFAYQCQPMSLANQSGWFVLAPHAATVDWNGGRGVADVTIEIPGNPPAPQATSAVGHGIMTWTIPYVFRTPPGWNLLCRGPANYFKDGVAPLEGLVETDWSFASFSMNWQLTRPGRITFEEGEPIAMLVPQMRGEMEKFTARKAELASNPELFNGYAEWIKLRNQFLEDRRKGDPEAVRLKYQKHYARGMTTKGITFEGHQRARHLAPFAEPDKT